MKTMLITGASRGLGRVLKNLFEGEYNVITTSKNGIGCDHALDLTNWIDLEKAMAIECDVLINNAATPTDDFFNSVMLNLNAAVMLTGANHERMTEGAIINISSISSQRHEGIRYISDAYIVTKTALSKFTNLLIAQRKHGIKICCVEPELIADTEFTNGLNRRLQAYAMDPNDVATTIKTILDTPPHLSISNITLRYV